MTLDSSWSGTDLIAFLYKLLNKIKLFENKIKFKSKTLKRYFFFHTAKHEPAMCPCWKGG